MVGWHRLGDAGHRIARLVLGPFYMLRRDGSSRHEPPIGLVTLDQGKGIVC